MEASGGKAAGERCRQKHDGSNLPESPLVSYPGMVLSSHPSLVTHCIHLLGLPKPSVRYWVTYTIHMVFSPFWRLEVPDQVLASWFVWRLLSLACKGLPSFSVFIQSFLCARLCPYLVIFEGHPLFGGGLTFRSSC